MGLFDFVKAAGEKLFRAGDTDSAAAAAAAAPDDQAASARLDELNRTAGDAIEAYITTHDLPVTGLTVTFDGAGGAATVFGVAGDHATNERICSGAAKSLALGKSTTCCQSDQGLPKGLFNRRPG